MVLSIDLEKKRVSFGLKPSYFEDDEEEGSEEEGPDEEEDSETLGVVGEDFEMLEVDAQRSDDGLLEEAGSD